MGETAERKVNKKLKRYSKGPLIFNFLEEPQK
jgi:hypothetical protein